MGKERCMLLPWCTLLKSHCLAGCGTVAEVMGGGEVQPVQQERVSPGGPQLLGVQEQDPPPLPQPQRTVSCTAHPPPLPGCTLGRLGGCSFPAGAQASTEVDTTANSAGDVDKRAEQGMSRPAKHDSTFYGSTEELKTVSPPWRAARLARMASCSVPSGLTAGDTASLHPGNSVSLGAECQPPSAHVREDKAGQRLGRAWSTGTSCAGRLFGLETLSG